MFLSLKLIRLLLNSDDKNIKAFQQKKAAFYFI